MKESENKHFTVIRQIDVYNLFILWRGVRTAQGGRTQRDFSLAWLEAV
jgi:hypothetical protein